MPYKHAGEIGDVWKHLPLCGILKIEKPKRYRESNSAYSGYNITVSPKTEYGIFRLLKLKNDDFINSEYFKALESNGIGSLRYTGSPGLAMTVLAGKTRYFFHDVEQEALNDIKAFARNKALENHSETFCGDSICSIIQDDYFIDEEDFVFLDPYDPFDTNEMNLNFFDIFEKAVKSNAKTVLWYGYESLNGQRKIFEKLDNIADEYKTEIYSFDVWLKSMNDHGCGLNPGVPGCGIACVNLSEDSINITEKYLKLMQNSYINAEYCGCNAGLFIKSSKF